MTIVAGRADSHQRTDSAIFIELGNGLVDFPARLDVLNGAGFDGWIIIETDVTQQLVGAKESATVSREYLRSIGIQATGSGLCDGQRTHEFQRFWRKSINDKRVALQAPFIAFKREIDLNVFLAIERANDSTVFSIPRAS